MHRLRDRVDAVLVGSGTARADDPRLTTRLPGGRGRDPGPRRARHATSSLPRACALFRPRSAAPTIVAHAVGARAATSARGSSSSAAARGAGGVDLRDLLARLAARGVTHLLVEGGARVHARFLEEGLVDRRRDLRRAEARRRRRHPARRRARARAHGRRAAARRRPVERVGDDVLVDRESRRARGPRGPVGEKSPSGARIRRECSPVSSRTWASVERVVPRQGGVRLTHPPARAARRRARPRREHRVLGRVPHRRRARRRARVVRRGPGDARAHDARRLAARDAR